MKFAAVVWLLYVLYVSELTRAMNEEPGQKYEILKIWVPIHGVVDVYRSPQGGRETVLEKYSIARKITALSRFLVLFLVYHVKNALLLEEPRRVYHVEKTKILVPHAGVTTVKRYKRPLNTQHKYRLEPKWHMRASAVRMRG